MVRKKTPEDEALVHIIKTRVTRQKFDELQQLLAKSVHGEMAGLLRDILHHRTIRTVVHDQSLDLVMEELAALRGEIRAIGVNINQITKHFNTYSERNRREFYARTAFDRYAVMEPMINRIMEIVTQLAKIWLRESPAAGR